MKLMFKAFTGFGPERCVSFPADELEKVTYAFLREKRVLLRDGQSIDGKYIQQISPDYHGTMGWNPEWRLDPDDMNEISRKGIDRIARDFQNLINDRVEYLITSGDEHLVGKNALIVGYEVPTQYLSYPNDTKRLGPKTSS